MTELYRESIVENLVFISGFTRSGKALMCPILASLEDAENVKVDLIMEQYPMLNAIGEMSDDTAAYLVRYAINLMLYDNYVGRNSNFRRSDYTSIWKTADPSKHIQRLYAQEGMCVYDRIEEDDPLFVMMVHNGLWHANTYLSAFPKAHMVHMIRNPIDVIYSWHTKNYGAETYDSPRVGVTTVKTKHGVVPYYAKDWAEDFFQLKPMDRIVTMIDRVDEEHRKAYKALDDVKKKQVIPVIFEQFAEKPMPILDYLSGRIGKKTTQYTEMIMERERCPRVIDINQREEKLKIIKENLSDNVSDVLASLQSKYEEDVKQYAM